MPLQVIAPDGLLAAAYARAAVDHLPLASAVRRLLAVYAAGEVDVAGVPDPRVDRRLRRAVDA